MKVHEVMSKRSVTVSPDTAFGQLWRSIFKHHINALPVVDKKRKLLGIVTKEDLLKPIYPDYHDIIAEDITSIMDFEELEKKIGDFGGKKAEHLMSTQVIFARHDTPVLRALSRMITRNVSQLPVVSENMVLLGMVTKGDIFYALFEQNLAHRVKRIFSKKPSKKKK